MWPRLIIGGLVFALGLSLVISVYITPLAPRCTRFYGSLGLVILVPGLFYFGKGLKEYAQWVKRFRR